MTKTKTKTKKLHFWISTQLLKSIEAEAEKKGISRNSYIEWVLVNHLHLEPFLLFCQNKIKELEENKNGKNKSTDTRVDG